MKISEPYTLYPRTLSSGKIVYYYQYRMDNGVRSSAKSTGCTTLASAKRFCNKLYQKGEFEKKSSTLFSVFSEHFFDSDSDYCKWKMVNNSPLTDNTLSRYKQLLKFQLLPYFQSYQLSNITRAEVKKWIVWASEKWSAKTVNNAQTVLNLILNQAVEKEILNFNPALNLAFRKTDKKERVLLTVDEIRETYNSDLWKNDNLKNAFLLASITGMRISEIAGLQNKNIYKNFIDVKYSYDRNTGELGETKTKLKRKVPIPCNLILKNLDSDWVFPAKNGKPFNIVRMNDKLHQIWKAIGIDYKSRGLTTHTLRNFFISYLQENNVPEPKIRVTVGHIDSSMTGLYTYWKPEMLQEVYNTQEKLYKMIKE